MTDGQPLIDADAVSVQIRVDHPAEDLVMLPADHALVADMEWAGGDMANPVQQGGSEGNSSRSRESTASAQSPFDFPIGPGSWDFAPSPPSHKPKPFNKAKKGSRKHKK